MNRAHVQTLTLPTNPHLFSVAFNYMSMMHARPICPPKENNCQIVLDLRGQHRWHGTVYVSPYIYISSRVLTVLNLRNRGQCTCRKLTDINFIEPFMPAHMKASPYITAHYRNGIHASTLHGHRSYATEVTYSRFLFTPNIIDQWSVYWQQLKQTTA